MKLKVEEMQRVTLTTVFMAQEEKYKAEIERLTKRLQDQAQETKQELAPEQEPFPPHARLPMQEEVAIGEEESKELSQP